MLEARTKLLGPMSGPTLLVLIRKYIDYLWVDINLLVENYHDRPRKMSLVGISEAELVGGRGIERDPDLVVPDQ
jgi:hypothetical protein